MIQLIICSCCSAPSLYEEYFAKRAGPDCTDYARYLEELIIASREAKLEGVTLEEPNVHRFLESCDNTKIREKIMERPHPTLTDVRSVIALYTKQTQAERSLANRTPQKSTAVAAIQQHNNDNNVSRPNRQRQPRQPRPPPPWMDDLDNLCWGCGGKTHGSRAEKERSCKAKNIECSHCHNKGHYKRYCYSYRKAEHENRKNEKPAADKNIRTVQEEDDDDDEEEVRMEAKIIVLNDNTEENRKS